MSGHCAENPSFAVFTKANGQKLAMKAYVGGHLIEITGSSVKVNGNSVTVASNANQYKHKANREEIFS